MSRKDRRANLRSVPTRPDYARSFTDEEWTLMSELLDKHLDNVRTNPLEHEWELAVALGAAFGQMENGMAWACGLLAVALNRLAA